MNENPNTSNVPHDISFKHVHEMEMMLYIYKFAHAGTKRTDRKAV